MFKNNYRKDYVLLLTLKPLDDAGDCVAGLLLYDTLCQDWSGSAEDQLATGQYHHTSSPTTHLRTHASLRNPRHRARHSVSPTTDSSSQHSPLSKSISVTGTICQLNLPTSEQLNVISSSEPHDNTMFPPPSPKILVSSDSVCKEDFYTPLATMPAALPSSQDLLPPSSHQVMRKVSAPLPVIPSISCSYMPRKSSAPCTVMYNSPTSAAATTSTSQQLFNVHPHISPLSISPSHPRKITVSSTFCTTTTTTTSTTSTTTIDSSCYTCTTSSTSAGQSGEWQRLRCTKYLHPLPAIIRLILE